ncbi:N-acetylmuramoyl-L-alanine amidase [Halomonas sp. EGI 63088]|uniref:N-acetylmuramoyl-L-alanine amidase n=1 Tax=Halomonas flagellata TaxID=2920385 RepID=A0ABS9RU51_9GAMM|nr:N-acetylmuramoyl-L-alanine amidase [Halomonas flagellata]MCH4563363.1 N-acetylmuramoyl-L-alanine amidase [Halomonas flagellata]
MGWITEVKTVPQAAPQRHTVVICAGHSNRDPGAVAHGYTEAGIVAEFRNLVSDELAELGIRHLTDGEGVDNWPLSDAVQIAAEASLAVEFHCNAASPAATGVETLSRSHNQRLGSRLCHAIADTLGIPNRGAKPETAGQHHRLAFVSDGGGIIVELFFLTHKQDLAAYLAGKRGLAKEVARVLADAARAS